MADLSPEALDAKAAQSEDWLRCDSDARDRFPMVADTIAALRAELTAARAEIGRLKGRQIRNVNSIWALSGVIEEMRKWYVRVPNPNRFSANLEGRIDQDNDGPWVIRADVDAALSTAGTT